MHSLANQNSNIMLKHATISRTSQAQQALQLQLHKHCSNQQVPQAIDSETDQSTSSVERRISESSILQISPAPFDPAERGPGSPTDCLNDLNNNIINGPRPLGVQQTPPTISCSTSPSPSLMNTPSNTIRLSPIKSTMNSLICSPSHRTNTLGNRSKALCSSESMIKVFAQTLSQDVEYVTLHVNTQTKSNQVVKSLLKKFRLKHRDPNLYHLTLERWIRKDGLKYKSVMLLGDEASPLQLQQCCSNPPHNDIKFTLQIRSGTLVKIFCSDVAPDSRYKCLSLSAHTTVEETIELMLHCLNLITPIGTQTAASCIINNNSHHIRSSDSPSSTGSSSSSNSSSSGIESDPTCLHNHLTNHGHQADLHNLTITSSLTNHQLDSQSRTSSVTSISSSSNVSNISTSITEQYCLVIECKDTNFRRTLDSDEYLVDVYQSLLAEANGQNVEVSAIATSNNINDEPMKQPQSTEQWFLIKLKRRDHQNIIKFANPRQNIPLPPIPLSMSQFGNVDNLQNIVSTAQIEVNQRPSSSLAMSSSAEMCKSDQPYKPPPATIILMQPPIRPRRRNLSNASSTFGRPLMANSSRRRYDPAQLAEDLKRLDVKDSGIGSLAMNSDHHS